MLIVLSAQQPLWAWFQLSNSISYFHFSEAFLVDPFQISWLALCELKIRDSIN